MECFDVLPVEISLHIFSLLPVESVSDYALVTKSWKNFIYSPPFYTMHIHRLMHLAKEAEAERNKKIKECVEYTISVTQQFLQTGLSKEQLLQIRENVEEKRNSMRLTVEKRSNILRLASKCVEKCKHSLINGGSPLEAGEANHSTAKTLDLKRKVDVVGVAAKEPNVKKQKVSENVEDPLPSWRKP